MSGKEWLVDLFIICEKDFFCNEFDELYEVILFVEILFFLILLFINAGDGELWISDILCWEGLLILFKVSEGENDCIGRHSIGISLLLQGIGEEKVDFFFIFVFSVVNEWEDTLEFEEHIEDELGDEEKLFK